MKSKESSYDQKSADLAPKFVSDESFIDKSEIEQFSGHERYMKLTQKNQRIVDMILEKFDTIVD